jgi:hypothetical protein
MHYLSQDQHSSQMIATTTKIKWYVKPVVFGGDPQLGTNVVWVSRDEHVKLVKYWNGLYRSIKSQ